MPKEPRGQAAIDKIAKIRTKNNRLWMKLMTIAVESNPKEAKKVIQKILKNDKEISKVMVRI